MTEKNTILLISDDEEFAKLLEKKLIFLSLPYLTASHWFIL